MKRSIYLIALWFCLSLFVAACGKDSDKDGDNGGNGGGGLANIAVCAPTCDSVSDCVITDTDEADWRCDDNFCEYTAEVEGFEPGTCDSDAECVVTLSAWQQTCESQEECATGPCIEYEGTGYCAVAPTDFLSCDTLMMEEQEFDTIEGDDTVTVCVQNKAACSEGDFCFVPECETNADCDDDPDGDVCQSGICGCSSDDACTTEGMACRK